MSEPITPMDLVLGELSEDREREAERLLREDAEFRAEVERLRPIAAALERIPGEVWDPVTPPPLRHPDIGGRSRVSWAAWLRRAFSRVAIPAPVLVAGAAALLVVGGLIGARLSSEAAGEGREVALAPLGAQGGSGVARIGDAGDAVRVEVAGLTPSSRGDFYEVWLLSGPDQLVSLGAFTVAADGSGSFEATLPVEADRFEFLDISLEPLDGDPAHSSRSVLRAATV